MSADHGILNMRSEVFSGSPEERGFLLSFESPRPGEHLELRIHSPAPFLGELTFLGVQVQRAPLLSQLAPLSPALIEARDNLVPREVPWAVRLLFGLPPRSRRSDEVPSAARDPFRRADMLRDSERWLEAANHYREGLRLAPDHAGYLVQLGNTSKEAGEFQAAERAYRRALSLDPGNRDTLLQLGDLLKRTGRIAEAEQAFMMAAMGAGAAIAAFHELMKLGLDSETTLGHLGRQP